jgi:hypothetical protein
MLFGQFISDEMTENVGADAAFLASSRKPRLKDFGGLGRSNFWKMSDQLQREPPTGWPDWTKFRHLGYFLKAQVNFLVCCVYFISLEGFDVSILGLSNWALMKIIWPFWQLFWLLFPNKLSFDVNNLAFLENVLATFSNSWALMKIIWPF